ncbi:Uncharacterized protein TCM_014261 [Theobroma cacao]|uniref:Uncharacterized protein n=1 Tax=Theobroma cacao TaxID=3641 RepID=A0A061G4V6_THECC|nr:Uncharacterized protein TCM_014261 [Theobroma cacao]
MLIKESCYCNFHNEINLLCWNQNVCLPAHCRYPNPSSWLQSLQALPSQYNQLSQSPPRPPWRTLAPSHPHPFVRPLPLQTLPSLEPRTCMHCHQTLSSTASSQHTTRFLPGKQRSSGWRRSCNAQGW